MKYWLKDDVEKIAESLLTEEIGPEKAKNFGKELKRIINEMVIPEGFMDKQSTIDDHIYNASQKYYQILMLPDNPNSKNKWKSNLKNNILKFIVRDNKHGKSIILTWDELNDILNDERLAAFEEAQEKLEKDNPQLSNKAVDDYDKFTIQDMFKFTGKLLPDWKNKRMKYRYQKREL